MYGSMYEVNNNIFRTRAIVSNPCPSTAAPFVNHWIIKAVLDIISNGKQYT